MATIITVHTLSFLIAFQCDLLSLRMRYQSHPNRCQKAFERTGNGSVSLRLVKYVFSGTNNSFRLCNLIML